MIDAFASINERNEVGYGSAILIKCINWVGLYSIHMIDEIDSNEI